MNLPHIKPLELSRRLEPFNDRDFVFELKHDGFRCIAYVSDGKCDLVSRRDNQYKSFNGLRDAIASELHVRNAILDGEIVCLDGLGRSQFQQLLFRRGDPVFYAFDLLWLNGRDLRHRPLLERKRRLRRLIRPGGRILFAQHVPFQGRELFKMACDLDLEGVIAKRKNAPYAPPTSWIKVKNRTYSQIQGRHELFENRRPQHDTRGTNQTPRDRGR